MFSAHTTLSSATVYEFSIVTQLHTTVLCKFTDRAEGDSRGADSEILKQLIVLTAMWLYGAKN